MSWIVPPAYINSSHRCLPNRRKVGGKTALWSKSSFTGLSLQTSSTMDFNASVNPRNRAKSRVFPRGFDLGLKKSPSLSSSSSSRLFPDETSARSPLSTSTPLMFSSGVPFSWEKLPGVPKRQTSSRRNDSSTTLKLSKLLPLPPSAIPKKHGDPADGSFRKKSSPPGWDPFVAALVECSKDDAHRQHGHQEQDASRSSWTGAKFSRSVSDRFGFTGLYTSCKRTCAVDESIVYVPRSSSETAAMYGLIRYDHRGSRDKWSPILSSPSSSTASSLTHLIFHERTVSLYIIISADLCPLMCFCCDSHVRKVQCALCYESSLVFTGHYCPCN